MRRTFIHDLEDLTELDKNIFLISADIGFGVLENYANKFPDNYINAGIAESNAVSMATGMALKGKIPFVYTINSFLVFKTLEQIRMAASMNQKLILVGTGLNDEYTNNGISHYAFGDKEILNNIPGVQVLTPKNKRDITEMIKKAYDYQGVSYLRISRFSELP